MSDPRHCSGCRGYTRDWHSGCQGIVSDLAGISLEDTLTNWARCNLGSGQVSPADQKVVTDFAATLTALDGKPDLRWREQKDGYWQEWYCPPPPLRVSYRLMRFGWVTEDEHPVLRIYQIEVADATQAQPGEPAPPDSAGPARPGPGGFTGAGHGAAAEAPKAPEGSG